MFLNKVIDPNSIIITSLNTTNNSIVIKAEFRDGFNYFKKYKLTIKNDILLVKIIGGISLFRKHSSNIYIHFDNTNKKIKKIYLLGKKNKLQIWKNK
ncbi:hypothetical protein [Amphibacillus sediminis]|uniref:hypothetical protein n=1 Tax=Amphibacillus sediminis TaxID=360185 RepID=UPI0008323071|nr:hypothetical protein [Amphibacillus sediminis]